MIRRVLSLEELSALPLKGIEAQKIRSILLAYGTKYDFCRFYVSEDVILCETDGNFVLCEIGRIDDISELADFLEFNGFSEIFCSETLGKELSAYLKCGCAKVNLMRFCGAAVSCAYVDCDPRLEDVFKILSSSFDINYEHWYVDMSHRIRHNVAKSRRLGGSALIIQHDINGEALLSQIATLPEERGRGNASRLISSVCAELSASDVYVVCEDTLLPFYRKAGFEKIANKFIFTKNIGKKTLK